MKTYPVSGILDLILSNVIWGLFPLFWSLLTNVNSVYILAHRILWSMVIMGAFLILKRHFRPVIHSFHNKKALGLCMICSILITLNWGIYIYAVNSGQVLAASMGCFIGPVLAALIGILFFKERPAKGEIVTICFAFAGLLFILFRTGRLPVMALLVAGPFSVYGGFKKKLPMDADVSLFMETLLMFPAALIFSLVFSAKSGGTAAVLHGASFWLLPACGLATTVPLLFYNYGIKKVPYYLNGILSYINPTLQFLCGLFFFHEDLDRTQLISFIIIWIGILFTVAERFRQMRASALITIM